MNLSFCWSCIFAIHIKHNPSNSDDSETRERESPTYATIAVDRCILCREMGWSLKYGYLKLNMRRILSWEKDGELHEKKWNK